MRDDFGVFILTHGRPNNIKTLRLLEEGNYQGKWYIVIDNEDPTSEEYYKNFGEKVIMFDKQAIAEKFDEADNFSNRKAIFYARNATWQIAEELGLNYFIQLDDDYTNLAYRIVRNGMLRSYNCKQIETIFNAMIKFLDRSGALTVAFAQGGDLLGGKDSVAVKKGILRKAMNTFVCKTSNKFDFVGRINEDVNTYTSLGARGGKFFTICDMAITQTTTQKNSGGMTETYLDGGTYIKSFYSVMFAPSCVTINHMGQTFRRIHHHIKWKNAVPKIISEDFKK